MSLGPTSQARRGIAVPAASVSSWGSALGLDIQLYIHGTPRWRSAILRLRREARDVRDGAQVILQRAGLPAETVVVLLAQLAELQVSLHGEDTVGLIPVGRIVLAPLPLVLQLMDLQAHALLLLALAGVVLELTHPEWRRQLFQLPRQPQLSLLCPKPRFAGCLVVGPPQSRTGPRPRLSGPLGLNPSRPEGITWAWTHPFGKALPEDPAKCNGGPSRLLDAKVKW